MSGERGFQVAVLLLGAPESVAGQAVVGKIALRVVLVVGVVIVVGPMVSRELRRRFVAKTNQVEQDVVQAEREQESGEIAKRIRKVPARRKPEWLRRWERKVIGIQRLGEIKGAKR